MSAPAPAGGAAGGAGAAATGAAGAGGAAPAGAAGTWVRVVPRWPPGVAWRGRRGAHGRAVRMATFWRPTAHARARVGRRQVGGRRVADVARVAAGRGRRAGPGKRCLGFGGRRLRLAGRGRTATAHLHPPPTPASPWTLVRSGLGDPVQGHRCGGGVRQEPVHPAAAPVQEGECTSGVGCGTHVAALLLCGHFAARPLCGHGCCG